MIHVQAGQMMNNEIEVFIFSVEMTDILLEDKLFVKLKRNYGLTKIEELKCWKCYFHVIFAKEINSIMKNPY